MIKSAKYVSFHFLRNFNIFVVSMTVAMLWLPGKMTRYQTKAMWHETTRKHKEIEPLPLNPQNPAMFLL